MNDKFHEVLNIKSPEQLFKIAYNDFNKKHNLTIKIGLEFEFILKNFDNSKYQEFYNKLLNENLEIDKFEKETGKEQYEISLIPNNDIIKLIDSYYRLKNIINNVAKEYNSEALFNAKPYGDDEVGNGLHIHISLHNKDNNYFSKTKKGKENLKNVISGILNTFPESLIFFNRTIKDLSRYKAKVNLGNKDKRNYCDTTNAPTHICWGYNNRTTAIRVPSNKSDNYHLELRVPSPNCNLYLALTVILIGIEQGIVKNTKQYEPIYGNAFDKQYNLKSLITNPDDLLDSYNKSNLKLIIDSLNKKGSE